MTLSTTANKVSYAGDGATVSFAIPFLFLENGHVEAILRDAAGAEATWALNTQFGLSGAGAASGGTLTVSTSPTDYTPANGETLVIRRVVPETQDTDYPEGGAFPAAAHEQALDKLTMLTQQHSEEIGRSLLLPVSSALADITMPEPGASELVRWNAAGTALETVGIADLSLGIPAEITTPTLGDTLVYDGTLWANRAHSVINLRDYGAVGDGSTDDTAAITSWLAAIASTGKTGYVPKGVYVDTLARTITTNISIVGEHPNKSIFTPASTITDAFYMTFVGSDASKFNAEISLKNIGFRPLGTTGLTGGVLRTVDATAPKMESVIIVPDNAASIEGIRFECDEFYSESIDISDIHMRNIKDCVRFVPASESGVTDRYRAVTGSGGGSFLQMSARDCEFNVNIADGTGWILNGGFARCTFDHCGGWVEGDDAAMFEARTDDLSTALFLNPWVDPAGTGTGTGMWRFRNAAGTDHYIKGGRMVGPSWGGRMTDITAGTFLIPPHWGGVIDGGADAANDGFSMDKNIVKSDDRWYTEREDFTSLDPTRWSITGAVALSTGRASTVVISPSTGSAGFYSAANAWGHEALDESYFSLKARFRVDDLTNMIFIIGLSRDASFEADIVGSRNSYLFTNENPASLGNASTTLSFVTVDTAGTAVSESVDMGTIAVDTDYEVKLLISHTGGKAAVFLDDVYKGEVNKLTFNQHIKAGAVDSAGSSALSIDHLTWSAHRSQ